RAAWPDRPRRANPPRPPDPPRPERPAPARERMRPRRRRAHPRPRAGRPARTGRPHGPHRSPGRPCGGPARRPVPAPAGRSRRARSLLVVLIDDLGVDDVVVGLAGPGVTTGGTRAGRTGVGARGTLGTGVGVQRLAELLRSRVQLLDGLLDLGDVVALQRLLGLVDGRLDLADRKSTRLNSSH